MCACGVRTFKRAEAPSSFTIVWTQSTIPWYCLADPWEEEERRLELGETF